ncbi:hypothetical protein RCG19_20725 [Neobacillus sp. OS1-2]|uniref:hypothetical protein n=1 Tax=Neobacillus sp. OS1-2 TaxID=3070680 RepID=UPI0027DF96B9|nr:hypothetical protein [Neobacillus sp. OS1-2]WML39570.1 hypothetical protein RCG19_20725 [Neobacillus sp. OS1-2]
MVQYLLRNGVKVKQTMKYMKINGRMYPKGTFVIPMNQAKRGVANAMLYKGDNVFDTFTLFANELAFRAHTHYSNRFIANCIFDSVQMKN